MPEVGRVWVGLALVSVFLTMAMGGIEREVMKRTLPAYTLSLAADLLNDGECRRELDDFRDAVDRRLLWALRMLDASGEPKSGFIYGNNYWLGSRHQCFDTTNRFPLELTDRETLNNTKYRDPNEEFPPFQLNYFVAHFRHNSTLQYHVRLSNEDLITLGLCLPASCKSVDLGLILNKIFENRSLLINELYSADFQLIQVRDLVDDHQWLIDGKLIFVICLLSFSLTLMLVGTIYDVCVCQRSIKIKKSILICDNNNSTFNESKGVNEVGDVVILKSRRESLLGRIILCFSVHTNTRTIFATKLGEDSIPAIHGLRFLGMVWIIMIHTIFYMGDYADNKPWSWRVAEGFAVQVISNSTLAVDTFFFLSGFLVAYLYYSGKKDKEEKKPIKILPKINEFLGAVFRRFMRLTPAYMMMVGIVELNSGWYNKTSQFYSTEKPHDTCAKYWWRNLLYINNLFGRKDMCMSWSWYLANDMQFFIISTFLLILSSIYFYTAVAILFSLLLGSIIITGYLSYINDYVPTMDEQYHFLDVLYDPPWTRIGPYIIGIITAYILLQLKYKLILRKRMVVLFWFLGSLCNILVLFGLCERHISVLASAIYVALSRTIWGVGLAWLLIACCTKHGGLINTVLSFRGWVPLSRLTYCAYLLNPFIINSIYLHSESAVHVDFLPNGTMFLGNFAVSYFCAYALSLMMETPYILLMRMFINSRIRKK